MSNYSGPRHEAIEVGYFYSARSLRSLYTCLRKRLICRGFGFVTFRDQESVQEVLEAHEREPLTLDHKKVG